MLPRLIRRRKAFPNGADSGRSGLEHSPQDAKAIRELNALTRELQACPHCPRGNVMPVLGSGHPQADVMMLKYAPQPAEVEEGVAFYGRAGGALMKSLKRLSIDPLAVYGTLCAKCPLPDPSLADWACVSRVSEEIAIVQPRIIVVMG